MLKWLSLITGSMLSMQVLACTNGEAVVGGRSDYPPLSWDNQGKLDGIAYAIISTILKEKNLSTTLAAPAPWKRHLKLAESGDIDILVTIRENRERQKDFAFVDESMMNAAQTVFFLKESPIRKKDDLKGKVGGVTLGVSFEGMFEGFASENLTFHEVARLEQNIRMLESKRIDYFISPLLSTLHFMNTQKISVNLSYLPRSLFATNEKVAISRRSQCLEHLDYINQRLSEMHRDGTIDRLLEKEFLTWTNISHIIDNVSQSVNSN